MYGPSFSRHLPGLAIDTATRVTSTLLLLLVGAGTVRGDAGAGSQRLEKLVVAASTGGRYERPSLGDLRRAHLLFTRTFRAIRPTKELRQAWADLKFELETDLFKDEGIWVLREHPRHTSGRGFYAIRRHPETAIALQAPHSFYDQRSREIAARLFLESRVSAAAWNTMRRRVADLAHVDESYLSAFTQAFVDVQHAGMVVQLHGYSRTKRKTPAGAAADLILSSGTRSPDPWFRDAGRSFQREFTLGSARVYPWEVVELGGTTNRQGAVVRSSPGDAFLHLEMSKGVRERLLAESPARTQLLKCLSGAYRHFQTRRNGSE